MRISPCDLREARNIGRGEVRVAEEKQNLLQLYRFCFLMLADAAKARADKQLLSSLCSHGSLVDLL